MGNKASINFQCNWPQERTHLPFLLYAAVEQIHSRIQLERYGSSFLLVDDRLQIISKIIIEYNVT